MEKQEKNTRSFDWKTVYWVDRYIIENSPVKKNKKKERRYNVYLYVVLALESHDAYRETRAKS